MRRRDLTPLHGNEAEDELEGALRERLERRGNGALAAYHLVVATPWDQAAATFRAELTSLVPAATLKDLHRIRPGRHAVAALRHVALGAIAVWVIVRFDDRGIVWGPAVVVLGFVIFGFTVLLHEVVHGLVTRRRDHWLHRVLAHAYALPSGLSQAQFTRWHLDHHDHLGVDGGPDPKRSYLSPRRGSRLEKALYFTPALFPIYFRAARCAAASYPPTLRRRIAGERAAAVLLHVALPLALGLTLGWDMALKLHLLPVFVVFPVAFTINRLGQHYDIDPDDPAKWGTLIRPSPLLWDPLFLWSNYHLEHHYFPRVPFYNLPALHRALRPFFDARGMRTRTYSGLLVDWLLRNRTPHTRWVRRERMAGSDRHA